MSAPFIVSLGEVLWDCFPDGPRFGGAPANFACHAALLGARVSMVSAVGNDTLGAKALEILRSYGIDTSLVSILPNEATGQVNVTVDAAGKPEYEIRANAAWDQIPWTAELEARIAGCDAVYFGTLGQRETTSRATIRKALTDAKQLGKVRVVDVNLRKPFYSAELIRESVALASVLKLSDEELTKVAAACGVAIQSTTERTLRALREKHSHDCVALTRGAEGALVVSASETIDQPGIPVVVRDTVGAGDTFTAALTVGLLCGDSLKSLVKMACEAAAATCAFAGAVPE